MQASAGVYYAFFASFLFLVVAVAACWRNRSLRPSLPAALLVAITVAGVAANTAPSLIYWHREGSNAEVAHRTLSDTEIFALKLAPLLLPIDFHNLPPLAALRWRYNTSSLLLNESGSATLGLIGSVGFLAIVAQMEAALPAGAAVYQLPYAEFPEGDAVCLMDPYEHFRPYLHAQSLRFSHGAMRGRDADRWHRSLQGLSIDDFLNEIEQAGFQAVYIDRRGYGDGGRELETKLRERLSREPVISKGGDRACFVLCHALSDPTLAADRRPSTRLRQ